MGSSSSRSVSSLQLGKETLERCDAGKLVTIARVSTVAIAVGGDQQPRRRLEFYTCTPITHWRIQYKLCMMIYHVHTNKAPLTKLIFSQPQQHQHVHYTLRQYYIQYSSYAAVSVYQVRRKSDLSRRSTDMERSAGKHSQWVLTASSINSTFLFRRAFYCEL